MHMVVRSAIPLLQSALEEAQRRSATDEVAARLVAVPSSTTSRRKRDTIGGCSRTSRQPALTPASRSHAFRHRRLPLWSALSTYWLRHHHPISLLGHIAVVEGCHPPAGFARRLRASTGFSKTAFRALERHESLDLQHTTDLYNAIDRLPLRPEHEQMMGMSALHTVYAGIDVLVRVYESVSGEPVQNAASVAPTGHAKAGTGRG